VKRSGASAAVAKATAGQASKAERAIVFCEDVPASLHYAVTRKKSLRLDEERLRRARSYAARIGTGYDFYDVCCPASSAAADYAAAVFPRRVRSASPMACRGEISAQPR